MSGTVTGLDLDRLEELAGNATRGPWFIDELDRIYVGNRADGRDCGLWEIVYATGDDLGDLTPRAQERERADAEFIAAMRNAAPSLLAAARQAEAVRVAVHLDDDEPINTRDAEPCDDDWQRAAYEDGWDAAVDHMRDLVRAALGTEQEGRD